MIWPSRKGIWPSCKRLHRCGKPNMSVYIYYIIYSDPNGERWVFHIYVTLENDGTCWAWQLWGFHVNFADLDSTHQRPANWSNKNGNLKQHKQGIMTGCFRVVTTRSHAQSPKFVISVFFYFSKAMLREVKRQSHFFWLARRTFQSYGDRSNMIKH